MPVGFGFSVGDFISAAATIRAVGMALKDCGGASTDYQETLSHIESITAVIQHMEHIVLDRPTNNYGTALYGTDETSVLIKGINGQAAVVHSMLVNVIEKIRSYDRTLGVNAPKGPQHGTWSKAKWGVYFCKEMTRIRPIIASRAMTVQLMFQVLQVSISSQILTLGYGERMMLQDTKKQFEAGFSTLHNQLVATESNILDLHNKQALAMGAMAAQVADHVNTEQQIVQTKLSDLFMKLDAFEALFMQFQGGHQRSSFHGISRVEETLEHTSRRIMMPIRRHRVLFNRQHKQTKIPNSGFDSPPTVKSGTNSTKVIGSSTWEIDESIMDDANLASQLPSLVVTLRAAFTRLFASSGQGIGVPGYKTRQLVSGHRQYTPVTDHMLYLHSCLRDLLKALLGLLIYLKFTLPKLSLLMNAITIRSPLQLNIVFEDVLGRRHGLPWHYFRDWRTFKAMLQREFEGYAGQKQVFNGDYRLLDARFYTRELTGHNWERSVVPGTEVVMSVLLKKLRPSLGGCARIGCNGVPERRVGYKDVCNTCGLEIVPPSLPPRVTDIVGDDHVGGSREHRDSSRTEGSKDTYSGARIAPKTPNSTPRADLESRTEQLERIRARRQRIETRAENDMIKEASPFESDEYDEYDLSLFRRVHFQNKPTFTMEHIKRNMDSGADIPEYSGEAMLIEKTFQDANHLWHPARAPQAFLYLPPVDDFTYQEHQTMLQAFFQYPKKWGKIADSLNDRNYKECVAHYYTTKWDGVYAPWRRRQTKRRTLRRKSKKVVPVDRSDMSDH